MVTESWKEPVSVFAGRLGNVRWLVGDAVKASEILLYEWPRHVPRGPQHLRAQEICLKCLQGKCDAEEARAAFVAAAQEADILA